MVKKNNLIEEIQAIVQHIETNYQEEVDFKWIAKNLIKNATGGFWITIFSPRLKEFCREKFNFPNNNRYLDWEIGDDEGNDFYYRINEDYGDHFELANGKLFRIEGSEKPKKCKGCGKLSFYEKGRIVQWSGRKTSDGSRPNIIAYLHPECAKKYFAGQEQPSQNEVFRLKEKLLRNLDKICIDPIGYLVNAELLKKDSTVLLYNKGICGSDISKWKELESKVQKVEIEGEIIDLEIAVNASDLYEEIKKALVNEIKENKNDWQIKEPVKGSDSGIIVQHKDGRKHWKTLGFIKEWAEIETVLNGSPSPTIPENKPKNIPQLTSSEKDIIRNYMKKNEIISLTLFSDILIVEYKNKPSQRLVINNSELQNIQKCLEKTADKSLSWEQIRGNSNSTNQPRSPNYTSLWISLGVGGGIVLGILATYLVSKVRKNKK
ncbi:MAG: hypothetical protein I3273_00985 [Candidatus Moeniiplasma glomeromycotorum]|nr:hypothetical protein [Candidatus Moeniiplasma glomeromycotorum]MCE8167304.1 hypothetical protein [Candidatus Moeniiplasma glomeromycotorum]MCE8168683.1 hypothetical protein [Candidatus Moeniiplasma glomeromycotorum]